MSIYRNTTKLGLAAAMLMAAAGGAFAQSSEYRSHEYMAYSAAPMPTPNAFRATSPAINPLVGPGVTTAGLQPGDRVTPVGAD